VRVPVGNFDLSIAPFRAKWLVLEDDLTSASALVNLPAGYVAIVPLYKLRDFAGDELYVSWKPEFGGVTPTR
jgi:hypothetical protein